MTKAPTDLQILSAIYERYYADFIAHTDEKPTRHAKNYVPIDSGAVAGDLGVDPDIVFGRLYFDLEKRYGYKQDDGMLVPFFYLKLGNDSHVIHFPYLASIVASLRAEHRRNRTSTVIALVSLGVSVVSLAISIFVAFNHHAAA
jgi:hypothetical protein